MCVKRTPVPLIGLRSKDEWSDYQIHNENNERRMVGEEGKGGGLMSANALFDGWALFGHRVNSSGYEPQRF